MKKKKEYMPGSIDSLVSENEELKDKLAKAEERVAELEKELSKVNRAVRKAWLKTQ
jgi:predicted nuclease with TOPRIM domain